MLGFVQREGTFTCNMRLGIPHVSRMWLAFNIVYHALPWYISMWDTRHVIIRWYLSILKRNDLALKARYIS